MRERLNREERQGEERKKGNKKLSVLFLLLLLLFMACLGVGGYAVIKRFTDKDGGNTEKVPVEITLTLELNGGNLAGGGDINGLVVGEDGVVTKKLQDAEVYGELPNVTKENNDFEGWFTALDETGIKVESGTKLLKTENHTLYAKFSPTEVKYTIVYRDMEDSTQLARNVSGVVQKGDVVNVTAPDILGYTLKTSAEELSVQILQNNTNIEVLYERNTYKIRYSLETEAGETLTHSEITSFKYSIKDVEFTTLKAYEELYLMDSNFALTGYGFKNWSINGIELQDKSAITVSMLRDLGFSLNLKKDPTDTITLKANFAPLNYSLIFMSSLTTKATTQSLPYKAHPKLTNAVTNVEKLGYVFKGWYEESTGETGTDIAGKTAVDLLTYEMPAKTTTLYAGFELKTYTLTINTKGGTLQAEVAGTFTIESEFTVPVCAKEGYVFNGYIDDISTSPIYAYRIRSTAKDITLTADYSLESYSINIMREDGQGSYESIETRIYTIESDDIVISNANGDYDKAGYTFAGFSGTGLEGEENETITVAKGSVGNRYFYVHYEVITYNLTYLDVDGTPLTGVENPSTYTIETEDFKLNNPDRTVEGYIFEGWSENGGIVKGTEVSVTKGSTGDKVFQAHYRVIVFNLTLQLNGGTLEEGESESKEFNVESDSFSLPTKVTKKGYTFIGWTSAINETPSINVEVPKGTKNNLLYIANYEAIKYRISYDFNGGAKQQYGEYKESYTIEDEVTPEKAVKTGYIFVSWEVYEVDEMGNETLMENVHFIEKGSIGNKKFVAVYTPDKGTKYTVNHYIEKLDGTYELKEWQELKGETGTEVTPEVNKYNGFNSPSKITKTIQAEGLTTINYYYKRASYNVVVKTNGYIEQIATKAYKYEESVTIKATLKTGYDTMYWKGTSTTGETYGIDGAEITFTMPCGEVIMEATAVQKTYSITLKFNDAETEDRIIPYSYFSNDIAIEDPERVGYTFLGWSGEGIDPAKGYKKNLVIAKGSQGDRTYTAHWEAIVYSLSYELNGGELENGGSNPTSYTIETATFTLLNPSKAGYDFMGWKLEGDETGAVSKTVRIAKGSIGNRKFIAAYEAKTVKYKVIHKFMKTDGATYDDYKTDELNGKVDSYVTPAVLSGETIIGFTAPETQRVKLGTEDYATEVTYYYTRNQYSVNVTGTEGIAGITGSGTYYYGQEVEIKATVELGYRFIGFTGDVNESESEISVTVNAEDMNIVAEAEIIVYSIDIVLNGGSLAEGVTLASGFTLDSANGKITGTYTVKSNAITINYILSKYGYNFVGYSGTELSGNVKTITIAKGSTGNRAYTAQYEAIRYKIEYNLDDGSLTGANPAYYTIETEDFTLVNPTKIGYTFTGWSGTNLTGEENKEVTIRKGSTGELAYKAHFTANVYRVSFNYNKATSGTAEDYRDITFNTAYGELPTPQRTGYTFIGWYIMIGDSYNAVGDGIKASTIMNIANDHTLIAGFLGAKYTLTLNESGAGVDRKFDVYYDAPLPSDISKPTRLGYTFKGYYTQQNAKGEIYYNGEMVAQQALYLVSDDLTLYAYWERKTYNVILDKQNGTGGTDSVTALWSRTLPSATAPTRVGYTFKGYYDSQFGQGNQYYTDAMGSPRRWDKDIDNVTLYAYWTANSYTVTLERSGSATGTSNVTATYDSEMPNANAPYIVGKIFKGYFGSPSGEGTKYYDLASQACGERDKAMASNHIWDVANDTTIYAYYVTRYYVVVFSQAEATTKGTLSTSDVTYGNAMPSGLKAPQRVGYTFMGYYTGVNGTGVKYYNGSMESVKAWDIDEDTTTLYAHWQANTYTLTLKCNESGASPQTQSVTVTFDEKIPNISIPIYKGYTFVTYSMTTSDGEVALFSATGEGALSWTFPQDMTAYAKWIKNYYTITFDKQNGTGGTDSVSLGYTDSLPEATAPTREDYNFKGYFTGTNGNGTKYYSETMADNLGSSGYPYDYGITLYAYWTPITIKITVLNTTNLYYINGALYERGSSTMYKCTHGYHYSTSYSTSKLGCPDNNHTSGSKYYYCNHSYCKRWYSSDRHCYDSDDYWVSHKCSKCSGKGSISCPKTIDCPDCGGRGEITTKKRYDCDNCGGSGKVTTTTTTYGGHDWNWTDSVSGGRYKCSYCGKQYGAVGPPASDTECKSNKQTVETTTDCGSCKGTGDITITTSEQCPTCGGNCSVKCPDCNGTGSISCSNCGGDGDDGYWDTDYHYHNATSNGGYSKYKCTTCGQYTNYNESGCKHSYTESCYKYTLKYGTGTSEIYKGTSEAQYITSGYYWSNEYGALKDASGHNTFTYIVDGKVYYVNRFKKVGSTYYLYAQRNGTPKITDNDIDKYL